MAVKTDIVDIGDVLKEKTRQVRRVF